MKGVLKKGREGNRKKTRKGKLRELMQRKGQDRKRKEKKEKEERSEAKGVLKKGGGKEKMQGNRKKRVKES